jgi:hypothetical protein
MVFLPIVWAFHQIPVKASVITNKTKKYINADMGANRLMKKQTSFTMYDESKMLPIVFAIMFLNIKNLFVDELYNEIN